MQDVTLSLQLRILTFKVLHKAFQPSTLSTQILQEPSEERPEASGLARQIPLHIILIPDSILLLLYFWSQSLESYNIWCSCCVTKKLY